MQVRYLAIGFSILVFSCGLFETEDENNNSQVYDYYLEDINNLSSTYGQIISPVFFQGNVTLHYFGSQQWEICTARVGQLNTLYQDLLNQNIKNVQIIAIGIDQKSSFNTNWTDDNTIPVVIDISTKDTWTNWGASQWDLFFLDTNGNYVEDFNIKIWDYDKIYNSIMNIISGSTDSGYNNYNPDDTIDDGSCTLVLENTRILTNST